MFSTKSLPKLTSHLAVCLSFCASALFGVAEAVQERNFEVEKLAAENGLAGYDHSKQVQKKLLEFVTPMYREPLVSSQMIVGLSKISSGESVSKARQLAADRIDLAAVSMTELEVQSRQSEQFLKLSVLSKQGLGAPGLRQLGQASQNSAKVVLNSSKADLLRSNLELLKVRSDVAFETRQVVAESKLKGVKEVIIDPATALTGSGLNVLLDSLRPVLSSAVSLTSLDPSIEQILDSQQMSTADVNKIMLKINGESGPLVFPASQGSNNIGRPPLAMQHPQLTSKLNQIESIFSELRSESPKKSLREIVEDLYILLDELDAKSEEVIGTGHANAKKGYVQHRSYQQAKEYRGRLRSIVNRILLEGNTDLLRIPEGKYDPQQHGSRVVDFAKFLVDSGCKFAPANPGDAPTYARLQHRFLEIQKLLTD